MVLYFWSYSFRLGLNILVLFPSLIVSLSCLLPLPKQVEVVWSDLSVCLSVSWLDNSKLPGEGTKCLMAWFFAENVIIRTTDVCDRQNCMLQGTYNYEDGNLCITPGSLFRFVIVLLTVYSISLPVFSRCIWTDNVSDAVCGTDSTETTFAVLPAPEKWHDGYGRRQQQTCSRAGKLLPCVCACVVCYVTPWLCLYSAHVCVRVQKLL